MAERVTDLERQLDAHRDAIVVHCYRLLGSHHDAEEAAQEALLRAWRGRDRFRGEAAVGTWLHKIATRVCLDQLRSRSSRPTPVRLGPASDPTDPPAAASLEVAWLEPLPTSALVETPSDPAAAYTLAESVKLAFIAALQTLPPRQRAVLLLRDVLVWSAAETAEVLGMSVAAANSALQRARQQLRDTVHAGGVDSFRGTELADPDVRPILDAYVRAWESDDVDGLVETLRADVRLAMPPVPSWYEGRAQVVEFLRRWIFPQGHIELAPAYANAQPAFVLTAVSAEGLRQPIGVQVLTIDSGGIAAVDSFMSPELAARYLDES